MKCKLLMSIGFKLGTAGDIALQRARFSSFVFVGGLDFGLQK